MPASQHLRVLGLLNYVTAALAGLATLVLAVTTALVLVAGLAGGQDLMMALLPTFVVEAATTLLIGALAALEVVAGRQIQRGEGRLLQSALAVLGICNLPLGTLFGAYALWVCWINEDTVAILTGEATMVD